MVGAAETRHRARNTGDLPSSGRACPVHSARDVVHASSIRGGGVQHDAAMHGPRVRMHTDIERDFGVRSGRGGYGGKKPDWKDVKKPAALVIPKPINLPSRRKENNG